MLKKILNLSSRNINSLIFMYISGLILFALYLQYFQNIDPCPLCMLQRIVFIAIGLIALLAVLHNPKKLGRIIYSTINLIFCMCGIGLAGRHMWLESLPADQAPACGPSLEIMLELFPLQDVLKNAIIGDGECAKVAWSLFNLSIADWSMLCFVFLASVYIFLLLRQKN